LICNHEIVNPTLESDCLRSTIGPLMFATPERPDLVGRDVPALSGEDRRQQWFDKMVEFAQVMNSGSTGAKPTIPMQIFGLLDSSMESGFYKVSLLLKHPSCHIYVTPLVMWQPCGRSWWQLFAQYFNGAFKQIDCKATVYTGDSDGRLVGDTTKPWQNGTDAWSPGHFVATDHQFAISSGSYIRVFVC
jgi:hypothetical protein